MANIYLHTLTLLIGNHNLVTMLTQLCDDKFIRVVSNIWKSWRGGGDIRLKSWLNVCIHN